MPAITILIGVMLILVGIGGYGWSAASGNASPTALIPAVIGLIITVLGFLSVQKESWRKHLMHGALVVALLGVLGTISGFIKLFTLIGGGQVERPLAVVSQSITMVLCLVFILFGVKSFIDARKKV